MSILKKMPNIFFRIVVALALLFWGSDCRAALNPGQLKGKKVAVVVFAQNPAAGSYIRTALSRMEGILADNAITALDQDKAKELQDVFKTLDDPGAFVTAEDFVANAEKFELAALVAIYLHVEVGAGLADYFSAGAHADIRFIAETDAQVTAVSLLPMGAPGRPPSDGLTQNSAAVNAVQRAIDEGCGKLGLEISDPATPRLIRLDLKGPVEANTLTSAPRLPEESQFITAYAKLEKQSWRSEEATRTVLAPAGGMGAVAGYIVDTDFRRRPQRLYGARVHLVDTRLKREIHVLECFGVEKKQVGEKGDRRILDCFFVSSWRYLSAVSGGKLFFWDTERGVLLADPQLPDAVKSARLGLARTNAGNYLVVEGDKHKIAFEITRKSD